MRRGASWTAAYHPQLTGAAVARPVRSSVMPSSSVLLSGPGRRAPRRRLPGGAASGRPAGRRCRRGRRCQDAAVAAVTGVRCPPSRLVVRDRAAQPAGVRPSGVRPVRCPAVRCPAVRCPVTRVRRPGSADPAGCCPPVQRPALTVQPSGVQQPAVHPYPSGRVRLLPPPAVALGLGQGGRQPSPRQRSRSRWRPRCRAAWSTAEEPGGGQRRRGRGWSVGVSVADPGGWWAGGGGRACPLRAQAGQAGVRSVRGWRRRRGQGSRLRRELAAPAGWLPSSDWVATTVSGGRGGGPSGWPPARGAGRDGSAAPARPRLAAGVPGWLPAAL
jgi:hypothetical protein